MMNPIISTPNPSVVNTLGIQTSGIQTSGIQTSGIQTSGIQTSGVNKPAFSKLTRSPVTAQPRRNSVPANASLKTSPLETIVKPLTLQSFAQSPVQPSTQSPVQPSTQTSIQPSASLSTASALQGSPIQRLDNNLTLLQGVVEGLPDGIMILSDRGELTYDNSCARQICQNLFSHDTSIQVPQQVWRCCQALMDSRQVAQASVIQAVVIEDEIPTEEGTTIRIRVRWLDPNVEHPSFLVTLEDQQQSAQYRAYAEARRYRLTERETEVWVLKRLGLTYKAIAAKLHIAADTVKKHIKNIHARRDAAHWANG